MGDAITIGIMEYWNDGIMGFYFIPIFQLSIIPYA